MTNEVLCPVLAEYHEIITKDNIDSLLLDTYERTVGTSVTITCLSSTTHRLNGTNVLTCQTSGEWSSSPPVCDLFTPTTVTTTTAGPPFRVSDDDLDSFYTLLPYLAALIVLAIICTLLIVLLCYSYHLIKKQKRKSPFSVFESTRSSTPSSSLQTDLWVQMASPRHFRSHELAQSRDSMVQDLRYTPFNTDWSGY